MADARLGDPRDRGLATELVYGTLRWQRRMDALLAPYVRRGLDGIEPLGRALLRLGAYQLAMLDRIPRPIAVSATQDAARAMGMARLTKLLNPILRRVAEQLERDGERLPDGSSVQAIAARASLPDWIASELVRRYGDDAETEGQALRWRATLTVRPNLAKGGADALSKALALEGFAVKAAPYETVEVSGPGDPFTTTAFRSGLFVPQDPASHAVITLMGDVDGCRVLDLCAGRGIKATALAERGAHVTCVDIDDRKLAELRTLAGKLGVSERITTIAADATQSSEALDGLSTFDHVLVDAPCSGLGTLRRHPEIAWRRRPEDVGALVRTQRALLKSAGDFVTEGGLLTYAVCTFTSLEAPPTDVPDGVQLASITTQPSDDVDAFAAATWEIRR